MIVLAGMLTVAYTASVSLMQNEIIYLEWLTFIISCLSTSFGLAKFDNKFINSYIDKLFHSEK